MEPHIVGYFKNNGIWLIPPLVISIIYFQFSKNESLVNRLLVSAHGIIFAAASVFSIVISQYTTQDSHDGANTIFVLLILLGVGSFAYSVLKFRGCKWIHMLQIYNLAFILLAAFAGFMAISHDWI